MDEETKTTRRGADYDHHFNPATYLSLYEAPEGPEAAGDWGTVMTGHWKDAFSGVDGSRILDVGCGPTIHSVIPASRYFSQIYLADYAACNRQALNDWINRRPVAHEWAPFFKLWAQEEGCSPDDVEQRVRDGIKSVMFCDVTNSNPLEPATLSSFDCVITNLCLEAAAPSEHIYRREMENVVRLLRPGGRLLLSGALNETEYYVGEEVFYCLSVSERLMVTAVQDAGCTIDELHVHPVSPEVAAEFADCSAYFFLKATKKKDD